MRVIEIAGDKFVVGLEWFTVENEKKQLSKFLKEKKAKRYVKVISKNKKYVNIGIPKGEVKDVKDLFKYPVLAPSLATVKNTSWAGIFKIDENTYYHIAVGNDGIILPDGDVIGTKEEVTEVYFRNLELLDEWGELTSEGTIDDLYNLTLHIKKKYYFNSEVLLLLDGKILYLASAVAIAVIVASYLAYKKKTETQQQTTHLNFEVIKRAQQQQQVNVIQKTTVAEPQELINSCYKAYYDTIMHYPGWTIKSVVCTPESITIELSKISNAQVVNMQGINVVSPESANRTIKPEIKTQQIIVGENKEVIDKINAWSLKWKDVQLVKQLQPGQFTATGQSNLALGELIKIKGIYATSFTLTNNWKLEFVTEKEEEKEGKNK